MELKEGRQRPIELLRYTGLFAWLCASIPLFLMPFWYDSLLGMNQYLTWWVLHLVFGLFLALTFVCTVRGLSLFLSALARHGLKSENGLSHEQ